jgi:SAM-dependent methyltransferase
MADKTTTQPGCPVCGAAASLLDVVDLNKSCEEARGGFLPIAGAPVYYALCDQCGFCFAPDLQQWSLEEFSSRIYNDDYKVVDPDSVGPRPRANARWLAGIFADHVLDIRHLDYGGGNGMLSQELFAAGWNSTSYDPFFDGPLGDDLGRFNLVTSFEVFEHVPDVNQLISSLSSLVEKDGIVLFSTVLSDGSLVRNQRLRWWYAAPRNGHISLFSRRSLALLGAKAGFELVSIEPNLHAYWRESVPSWAAALVKTA